MASRVVISGANRGLGYAIADGFHARGHRVGAINRTLCGAGWMEEFPCDLRSSDAIRRAFDAALSAFGGLDVCVCNAAVRRLAPVEDMPQEHWDELSP